VVIGAATAALLGLLFVSGSPTELWKRQSGAFYAGDTVGIVAMRLSRVSARRIGDDGLKPFTVQ
jgi:hypothetical protein